MKVDARGGSVVAEVRDESIVLLGGKGPVRIARREEPVKASGDAALERQAHDQERAGHFVEAAALYAQVAAQRTPRAATALYELGRLQLRSLHDPERALQSLHSYPGGPLAEEVALTAVEARMALKDDAASLREIDHFLQAFPQSDRADEVRALRASLTR